MGEPELDDGDTLCLDRTPSPLYDKEAAWAAFHALREAEDRRNPLSIGLRLAVFEAANWRCCYCGVRLLSLSKAARQCHAFFANEVGISLRNGRAMKSREATIEHIKRRHDGGGNERDNLAAACSWCNHSRGEFAADVWFDQVAWLKGHGQHPHF